MFRVLNAADRQVLFDLDNIEAATHFSLWDFSSKTKSIVDEKGKEVARYEPIKHPVRGPWNKRVK